MKQLVMLPPNEAATPHSWLMFGITKLPQEQRDVLLLFYHERLSLDEIAIVLGETEEEIAARFYWAHSALGTAGEQADLTEEYAELCVA